MRLNLLQGPEPAVERADTPGYESFFGLSANPFGAAPDPNFFFRSEAHGGALEILQREVQRRNGIVVLTGERGMGKTTLCHALADGVDRNTLTALLLVPAPVEQDFLTAVLQEFGVMSKVDPVGRHATTAELTRTLRDFLRSLASLNARATLVIDEAHKLSPTALQRLANLFDDEIDTAQLIQIVLIGEPALRATLQSPEARPLDQRVAVRHQLKPLAEAEVPAYVAHRLARAGAPSVEIFSPAALRLVHTYSAGIPKDINVLCDRVLLAAHAARIARVDKKFIASVAGELGLAPTAVPSSFFQRVLDRFR